LKEVEGLHDVFSSVGVDVARGGVLYCNGGLSACVLHAALEVLGASHWKVYDGSWNEYGNLSEPALETLAKQCSKVAPHSGQALDLDNVIEMRPLSEAEHCP
jgi:hypothetical protein